MPCPVGTDGLVNPIFLKIVKSLRIIISHFEILNGFFIFAHIKSKLCNLLFYRI